MNRAWANVFGGSVDALGCGFLAYALSTAEALIIKHLAIASTTRCNFVAVFIRLTTPHGAERIEDMDDASIIWVMLWVFIGSLVGVAIGKTKGRPTLGFFMGAFLGVIGWLLLLIGPDSRLKCSECLGAVPEGAKRCQHCGVFLQPKP